MIGIGTDTYANWEKGNTEPVASQFRPVVAFLGYDPTRAPLPLQNGCKPCGAHWVLPSHRVPGTSGGTPARSPDT
jgi:hypothetical protein